MRRKNRFFKHRIFWDKVYITSVGLIAVFLILMTIIMPRSFRLKFQYEVGKPWQDENLYAPFDFAIHKSADSIATEEKLVIEQILPIYVPDSTSIKSSKEFIKKQWQQSFYWSNNLQNALKNGDSLQIVDFRRELNQLQINTSIFSLDLLSDSSWNQQREKKYLRWLEMVYKKGYVEIASEESLSDFISVRVSPGREDYRAVKSLLISQEAIVRYIDVHEGNLSDKELELMTKLAPFIKPNYIYSEALTEQVRQQRRKLVSPVYGKVAEGEKIIFKDEIVDKETDAILSSLIREQTKRFGEESVLGIFFSQFLIILLITAILLLYLSVIRPRIFFNNSKLGLVLFTLLLAVGMMVVATKLNDLAVQLSDIIGPNLNLSYIYLAPVCIVPIFMTNFFGLRTGFLTNILVALYGSVLIQQGLEFAFVQTIAGTITVYSMRRLRDRKIFFYTLFYIFVSYSLAYTAFNLFTKGNLADINFNTLLLFAINVSFTMIAYNLIFLLERLFGLTSDLTYLELLDTNHPLLKELARKAPGTFNHSLQVANIAEATINEIGGNTLLIHVGALYHDIGKIINQRFFIENMAKGQNPHDEVSCEESASIIIGHVKEGVELAQKYSLPREIIEFIETHHGTTRVEFFYRQYLKENKCDPPEAEARFRYSGPKPFSKETAVLMISDSLEAASRAMKNPTPEKLEELVHNIIDYKIKDNQLENSNLTFKEIATIKKVIHKQLLSIYHSRIQYPKEAMKVSS
jgi:putative nucleotidyltransferase with HDIG domain